MIGLRPLGIPGSPGLTVVIAGACDAHLVLVRLYLSEFEPCLSVAPEVMLEEAEKFRVARPAARVLVLDKVG